MGRSTYQRHNDNLIVGARSGGSQTVVSSNPAGNRYKRVAASDEEIREISQVISSLVKARKESNDAKYSILVTQAFRDLRLIARKIAGV